MIILILTNTNHLSIFEVTLELVIVLLADESEMVGLSSFLVGVHVCASELYYFFVLLDKSFEKTIIIEGYECFPFFLASLCFLDPHLAAIKTFTGAKNVGLIWRRHFH